MVGLKWSHNTFFSLPIKVLFSKLTINITGIGNEHIWKAQYNKDLYVAFGKDDYLFKKLNILILFQLDNKVGARIYFMGEVFGSSPR
jgi:hypothetical protein